MPPRSRARAAALLAALLSFLVFLPSLRNGFVDFDDAFFLLSRSEWRGVGWDAWRWAFTSRLGSVYQPLSWITYGWDFALWGLDPRGYHLQSALWHALAAGLLALAARRVLAAARPRAGGEPEWSLEASALFAALIFGLHPLRVESVSWAAERRDAVCCAFFAASVLAYLRAREPGKPARSLTLSLGLHLLALLAKGMAMTLPLALLALDFYPLRRLRSRRDIADAAREKLPFFALSLVFALIGTAIQERMRWSWEQHGPLARVAQAAYAFVFYLRKTLWPADLLPLYELRPPLDPFEPRFLLSGAAVVLVFAGICRMRKTDSRSAAATAAASYALMLAPVSGLFQFGPQLVADRYSYLTCLPLALLAGAALRSALARRPAAVLAAVAICAGLAAASVAQQGHWRDPEALWSRVLSGDPDSATAHLSVGTVFASRGDSARAEAAYRRAAAATPGCFEEQFRLAELLATGVASDEEKRLRARVEMNPTCRKAMLNLGVSYAARGDLKAAEPLIRTAAALSTDGDAAKLNLRRLEAELKKRQPR